MGYDLTSYAGLGLKVGDIVKFLDPALCINLVYEEVIKIDDSFQAQYKKLRQAKPQLFTMEDACLIEAPLDSFEPWYETPLTKAIGFTLLYESGVDPECFDAEKNGMSPRMSFTGESIIPYGTLYLPEPGNSACPPKSLYCDFKNDMFKTLFVPYLKRLRI